MGLLDKIRQEAVSPTIKVPPRSDGLAPTQVVPELVASVNEVEEEEISEVQPVVPSKPPSTDTIALSALEEELASYPIVSAKKLGVRMEEPILEALDELCRKHDITIETLLESFYTICHADTVLMEQVTVEAQNRIKRRTRAGNLRSIITKSRNALARS